MLNVPIYSQALFPKYEQDRCGNLSLFTTSVFKPHEGICASYLWPEEDKCSIMGVEAYDIEGNNVVQTRKISYKPTSRITG